MSSRSNRGNPAGLLALALQGCAAVAPSSVPLAATSQTPGQILRHCADCPELVVIPAGRFQIGSPETEVGRGADEGPRQWIRIDRPFAVGRTEVARAQYVAFVADTGHPISGNCITDRRKPGDWQPDPQTNFQDPGFAQTGDHPVVCVSWNDAKAYIAWLSKRTDKPYRLLSEADWEYVARANSTTSYPWGNDAAEGCRHMNGTDRTTKAKYSHLDYLDTFGSCDDGYLNTAPVGSFQPNKFGLYDMIGNVGEWVQDCTGPYGDRRESAAPVEVTCAKRVVRGGSWGTIARQLRSAERLN